MEFVVCSFVPSFAAFRYLLTLAITSENLIHKAQGWILAHPVAKPVRNIDLILPGCVCQCHDGEKRLIHLDNEIQNWRGGMNLYVRDGESGDWMPLQSTGPSYFLPSFLPYIAAAQWNRFSTRMDRQNGDQRSHHFALCPTFLLLGPSFFLSKIF